MRRIGLCRTILNHNITIVLLLSPSLLRLLHRDMMLLQDNGTVSLITQLQNLPTQGNQQSDRRYKNTADQIICNQQSHHLSQTMQSQDERGGIMQHQHSGFNHEDNKGTTTSPFFFYSSKLHYFE